MRVSLGSEVISMMQLNKVSDGYDVSSREARLIYFLTSKIFQCFLILPCKTFEGFKKNIIGIRRDGSVVKNTGWSSSGPGFNSRHPHGHPHLSVTPVPGSLTTSHRHTCWKNTNAHNLKVNHLKKFFLNGAGKMALWLRALGALLEDLGPISSNNMVAHNHL